MDVFFQIFANNLVPVLLVAGTGWLLAHFYHPDVRVLSQISINALIPALIFHTLVTSTIAPLDSGRMGLFCIITVAVSALVARLVALLLRLTHVQTLAIMLVVMFTNVGNFGLPVIAFAFGPEALVHGTIYFIIMNTLMYFIGIPMVCSQHIDLKATFLSVIKMPAILSVILALVVILIRIPVPQPIISGAGLLSQATLPFNILILGMQLHAYQLRPTGRVWLAVFLRLVAVPLIVFPITRLLGLGGAALQGGMLQASTPAGVTTTILACQYDIDPEFVSNVVVLSTLLSVFTLTPLILLFT